MKLLGLPRTWTEYWLDLRLIAWRTGRVASLIWYPSLMIAVMAVAALTVEFGEFGFASNPIALVISAGFVVCAGVMLRRIAEAWRSDVLFRLEDAKLHALQLPNPGDVNVEQLDRLSERVKALSDGAFAPYSQQPMVRAVFVPALTYGATAGLQYLHISD
jgi:amino acid permease